MYVWYDYLVAGFMARIQNQYGAVFWERLVRVRAIVRVGAKARAVICEYIHI